MKTPEPNEIQFEAVGFNVASIFIGEPPQQYLAFQMKLQDLQGGQADQQWLGLSTGIAQRLIELLQTSLGNPTPTPQGPLN